MIDQARAEHGALAIERSPHVFRRLESWPRSAMHTVRGSSNEPVPVRAMWPGPAGATLRYVKTSDIAAHCACARACRAPPCARRLPFPPVRVSGFWDGVVGDGAVYFHAAVHRARVHDKRVRFGEGQARMASRPIAAEEFAGRGDQAASSCVLSVSATSSRCRTPGSPLFHAVEDGPRRDFRCRRA